MNEKRFRNNGSLIFDANKPLNTYDVVDLLNDLHEENRTLLHIIDWCLTHHREVGHIVFDSRDEFFVWLNEKGVLE